MDRWYGHGIVDDGPFSDWDPRTFANRPGDGSLFYPGPDRPIPSIRLENIRDGLEDYNLLDALGEAIDGAPPGTDEQLIRRAKHLLGATDCQQQLRLRRRAGRVPHLARRRGRDDRAPDMSGPTRHPDPTDILG